MSTEEYRAIRNQAQRLSTDEQFRLLEDLVAMLKKKSRPQHSILEFKGMGKEVWEGVDVDKYIRQERDSWESKNADLKIHSSPQDLSQPASDYLQEDTQVEMQRIRSTLAAGVAQAMKLPGTEKSDSLTLDGLGEPLVEDIMRTMKLLGKLPDTEDSLTLGILRESMAQMLNSLSPYVHPAVRRPAENTDLRGRDIGENITQERDSWGG